MDLNEIAIFIRIVEQKSLTRAARSLGLPKSTISRKLSSLEERLGVRLVQRTPRHVVLTEAGSLFHDRCAGLVAQVEAAEAELADLGTTPKGILRVSAGVDIGVTILARHVRDFLRLHPQMAVELVLTDRAVDLVGEGIDLAIRIGPVREASLVVRKLGAGGGVLCASPDYLASHAEPAVPGDLAGCGGISEVILDERGGAGGPSAGHPHAERRTRAGRRHSRARRPVCKPVQIGSC